MLEHKSEGNEQELLNEKITDDELRELLHRMGEFEFGGGEESRLRDVVEATGKDPRAIGRLLADIRKESFEEKYGKKIQEHEVRIEHLEKNPVRPVSNVTMNFQGSIRGVYPPPEVDNEDLDELRKLANERRVSRKLGYVMIPIAIIFSILASMPQNSNRPLPPSSQSPVGRSVMVDGVRVSGPIGGPYQADDHGKIRPATAKERDRIITFQKAVKARERIR